jgi:hypothetical protein
MIVQLQGSLFLDISAAPLVRVTLKTLTEHYLVSHSVKELKESNIIPSSSHGDSPPYSCTTTTTLLLNYAEWQSSVLNCES